MNEHLTSFRNQIELKNLSPVDKELLEKIDFFLSSKSIKSDESLPFIKKIYAYRWKHIKDTPADYLLKESILNKPWIDLAKKIARSSNESFLKILIPTSSSSSDPNALSLSAEQCDYAPAYYLSDNDKLLCRVRGLYLNLRNNNVFSTYKNFGEHTSYPLTLKELHRIRQKKGRKLKFIDPDNKQCYANFWDYLEKTCMRDWATVAKPPRSIIYSLYELVEGYFNSPDMEQRLNERLEELSKDFANFSPNEINSFFGQSVRVSQKKKYLVNVLLDIRTALQMPEDANAFISKQMKSLAGWLVSYDRALIINHSTLDTLYEHQVKKSTYLRKQLKALRVQASSYANQIKHMIKSLDRSDFDAEFFVKSVHNLYSARWDKIIDTDQDYTRQVAQDNALWIEVAQLMQAQGYVQNYYQLLMPTLKYTKDLVSLDSILSYDLRDCILSESKEALIYLPNCIANYKINGVFSVPVAQQRLFKDKEVERFKANKKFFRDEYLQDARQSNPPLSLKVLFALKKFVDNALYPVGLYLGKEYSSKQIDHAEIAFSNFVHEMYWKLNSSERQNLNNQLIIYNGCIKSFKDIYAEISTPGEQQGCVAVKSQIFVQLLVDYLPWIQFSAGVEKEAGVNEMRQSSANLLVQDDLYLKREIEQIKLSIKKASKKPVGLMEKVCNKILDYDKGCSTIGGAPKLYQEIFKLCFGAMSAHKLDKKTFDWLSQLLSSKASSHQKSYPLEKISFNTQGLFYKKPEDGAGDDFQNSPRTGPNNR